MRSTIALAIIFVLAAGSAAALDDPLLDRLAGSWVMTGTIAGGEITHDLIAEWVLDHHYLRFHEVSREREADGKLAYEAIVFLGRDEATGGYACLWLDSTGGGGLVGESIGHAERQGDELPFLFLAPDGSVIHNTFSYDRENDSWRWRIDVGDGVGQDMRSFARVTLTRNPGPDRR